MGDAWNCPLAAGLFLRQGERAVPVLRNRAVGQRRAAQDIHLAQIILVMDLLLHRLKQRDGDWRIAQRTYVMDWNRNTPSTAQWDEGIYAGLKIRGGRWPEDPLRAFLEGK